MLDDAVEEFVSKFKKLPPIAVGKAKMLINRSLDNDMITHLELESRTASLSAASARNSIQSILKSQTATINLFPVLFFFRIISLKNGL